MAVELESPIHDHLWAHIQRLNNLWVGGNPNQLESFFREDVVILHFDYKTRLRGREAVLNSYREFCDESTVHDFKQFKPVIDVFGNTAVVTYAFEIEYKMGDQTYNESGRDMFILVQEASKWLVIWRTMLPDPPETDTSSVLEILE